MGDKAPKDKEKKKKIADTKKAASAKPASAPKSDKKSSGPRDGIDGQAVGPDVNRTRARPPSFVSSHFISGEDLARTGCLPRRRANSGSSARP